MTDPTIRRDLRQFAEAIEEQRRRYPWRFFMPLPKQALFRRFVGQRFQVVLFQGGNWTGKTITGAQMACELAFSGGIQDYEVEVYLDGEGRYRRRYHKRDFLQVCDTPNMGRIIADKELVEKDVIFNLKKMLGPETFSTEKKGRPFESQWWFENGSSFDIMTSDQEAKQFEGVNLQWTWINEPPTESIFKAALGRFKLGGVLFISATILGCGWILDEIIESDNPRYKVVTMDIDENRESLGGYLPDQAVDDMLASQDPEEREARKSGKALKLAGRVFKGYRWEGENAHLVDLPATAPDGVDVLMATDPHDKIPNYSAWAYVKDGVVYFYREHPTEEFWEYTSDPWADIDELAQEYLRLEDRPPVIRLLDKKFGNTTKFGQKKTVREILADAGLDYEEWDGGSRTAVNKLIRKYLEQGKVVVSRRCKNMDKALRRHRFLDPTSARAKDEKGQREEVDEKTRHQIDVMGAILTEVEFGAGGGALVEFDGRPKSEEEELDERIWGESMKFDPTDYDEEGEYDIVSIEF